MGSPIVQLRVERTGIEARMLSRRIGDVVRGLRRQRCDPAGTEIVVQGEELAGEDVTRPVVEDDMVDTGRDHGLLGADPDQHDTHQRTAVQIEAVRQFVLDHTVNVAGP